MNNLDHMRSFYKGSRGPELFLNIEHQPSGIRASRFIPWSQVPQDIQAEIMTGPECDHGSWDHSEWLKGFEALLIADLTEKARAAMELVAA